MADRGNEQVICHVKEFDILSGVILLHAVAASANQIWTVPLSVD